MDRLHARRAASLGACLAACLALLAAQATAAPAAARGPRAVVAFLPAGGNDNPQSVLDRLAARRQLALGLFSATQGGFSPQQMVLDLTAGTRTSRTVYDPEDPPELELVPGGDGSGFIVGWSKALARARTALAEIKPGLLAELVPGHAGYAGPAGRRNLEAAVAADRAGDVASVSLGPSRTLRARARALLRRKRLVVVGLPAARKGDRVLDGLLDDRHRGDLLIVLQAPPNVTGPLLLPVGIAGLDDGGGALTSQTTRLEGIVAAIDVPVTIWKWLGVDVPKGVKGQPIVAEGARDPDGLKTLEERLRVVSGRRDPTLAALLLTWLAVTLGLGLVADRRGVLAGMRIGGLAFMWVLPVLLLTGWLGPGRGVEIALVVSGSFALGALTDRLVPWPRAPLVPAAVSVISYCVDLIFGSPLIVRSLLGVNPRSGSRFYGLGNELEATLVVLALVALGALLWGRGRSRATAAAFAVAGLVLGVFVGASQLGADVGGVLTVGAGAATATVLMLPGKPNRRTIAIAVLVPVAALFALAALDLVTGGNGHFTRSVLHADSLDSLRDTVVRRYALALNVLGKGAMPLLTLIALLAAAYAARYRDRVYAQLRGSPSWTAALVGGLVASVVGALFNDSGPILLTFGIFVLGCVTAYLRGDPRSAARPPQPQPRDGAPARESNPRPAVEAIRMR